MTDEKSNQPRLPDPPGFRDGVHLLDREPEEDDPAWLVSIRGGLALVTQASQGDGSHTLLSKGMNLIVQGVSQVDGTICELERIGDDLADQVQQLEDEIREATPR